MVHAQTAHMMNVYQLATREQVTASPVGTESENGSMVSPARARPRTSPPYLRIDSWQEVQIFKTLFKRPSVIPPDFPYKFSFFFFF